MILMAHTGGVWLENSFKKRIEICDKSHTSSLEQVQKDKNP